MCPGAARLPMHHDTDGSPGRVRSLSQGQTALRSPRPPRAGLGGRQAHSTIGMRYPTQRQRSETTRVSSRLTFGTRRRTVAMCMVSLSAA